MGGNFYENGGIERFQNLFFIQMSSDSYEMKIYLIIHPYILINLFEDFSYGRLLTDDSIVARDQQSFS